LRHYISSPDPNSIYYASGNEVYYLDTLSRKRKYLATLPFEARCTASGFGWVCVGGEEDGHFAAIKLDASSPLRSVPVPVDAPLPLDDWQTQPTSPKAANVKLERIGREIVNSISMHQIHDEENHLYDVVAVLTNNDKTVRVYSLSQAQETCVMNLPFPMNHASISPDGITLVAVGDSNQAFFYTRVMQQSPPQIPKPHNRLNTTDVKWELYNIVNLRAGDPTAQPGYFTTAWSPNGSLVALGSEGGHITVFDMDLFAQCGLDEAEDAVVATVSSTRPNIIAALHPGAVRSMLFSPEPWDLLIWAEDQGRVCIGDLRTGLKTKQVIDLKPDEEGLKKIELEDIEADDLAEGDRLDDLQQEILDRYRETRDPVDQANFTTESLLARELERYRHLDRARAMFPISRNTAPTSESDPRGLTAHEQQILEALRTTRQREEARAQGGAPRSINYTSAGLFTNSRSGTAATRSSDSPRDVSVNNHNDPYAAFPELSRTSRATGDNTLPPLHSIQEYLLLRDREREAALTSTSDRGAAIRRSDAGVPILTSAAPIVPPHATRATMTNTETDEDNPWRTISNAMNLARGPLFESPRSMQASTRQSREREAAVRSEQLRQFAQQRDRLRGIRREFENGTDAARSLYDTLTSLRGYTSTRPTAFHEGYEMLLRRSGREGATVGVRTAGLAISQDGRKLWAACEEGIFEIDLQVKLRMMFPAVDMK
jgi:WD40 repeat protein